MGTATFNERSTVIIKLQERGYEADFVLNKGAIACVQDKSLILRKDFEITERHFFIDDLRLENNCVIFAVCIFDSGIKGILMASYHHWRNNS